MFGLWENGDNFDKVSPRSSGSWNAVHVLLQRCVVVVVTEQRPSLSCGVVAPQHRRLLYDLFTRNYRVKRSAVQARLAQEFGDVSKAEVDRLFHVSDTSGVALANA